MSDIRWRMKRTIRPEATDLARIVMLNEFARSKRTVNLQKKPQRVEGNHAWRALEVRRGRS